MVSAGGVKYSSTHPSLVLLAQHYFQVRTGVVRETPHRKQREIDLQPSSCPQLNLPGWCLVSIPFLWGISLTTPVFEVYMFTAPADRHSAASIPEREWNGCCPSSLQILSWLCPIIVQTLSIICLNVQGVGGPWAMGQGLIKRVGQRLDKTKVVGCWTKGGQTVDFKGSRVCPNFVQLQGD